jgi:hypothetical protein
VYDHDVWGRDYAATAAVSNSKLHCSQSPALPLITNSATTRLNHTFELSRICLLIQAKLQLFNDIEGQFDFHLVQTSVPQIIELEMASRAFVPVLRALSSRTSVRGFQSSARKLQDATPLPPRKPIGAFRGG